MKKTHLLILALLFCTSAMASKRCRIEGVIDPGYNGYVSISLIGAKIADHYTITIPVSKGHLSKIISIPYYGIYNVMLDSNYKSMTTMVLDSTCAYLYQKQGDSSHIWCMGSTAMNAYIPLFNLFAEERDAAGKYVRAKLKQPDDTAAHRLAGEEIGKVAKRRRAEELKFIQQFPNSFVSAYELSRFGFTYELDTIKKMLQALGPAARRSPYGQRVLEKIKVIDEFAIDKQAPDFRAKDTSGVDHRLKDYRGKYVLLDICASWCAPCQMQLPYLRHVYEEFGDRVQVISLSVDTDRDMWVKGISRDGMAWLNVSDMGGFEGRAAKKYKPDGVPDIYFIGPDGRIIAVSLYDKGIYTAVKNELENKK